LDRPPRLVLSLENKRGGEKKRSLPAIKKSLLNDFRRAPVKDSLRGSAEIAEIRDFDKKGGVEKKGNRKKEVLHRILRPRETMNPSPGLSFDSLKEQVTSEDCLL